MKECDIRDYLYDNPEVLFSSGRITEKAREYSIQGKRIDLLFVVDEAIRRLLRQWTAMTCLQKNDWAGASSSISCAAKRHDMNAVPV